MPGSAGCYAPRVGDPERQTEIAAAVPFGETTQPSPPDPLIGTLLDRYRVLERLGEGGMGTVYAVEHVMLQKRMALKLLRADLCRRQELVTRFENEAVAASRIGQENIVNVTDFGRTPEGLVYFVMEELQGRSLAQLLRAEGSLSIERALAIAAQACRALHAAHAAGIIHRDIKPENVVLVPREGTAEFVKVLDFGISKMGEVSTTGSTTGSQRLTQLGMIVGTPEYMSPEQAAGKTIDQRADAYSLGVLLFEMLTGRLPFEAESALEMLMKHQTERPPRLAEAKPGLEVPELLEATVQRLLAKESAKRTQSMAELLVEIQACAEILGFSSPALWSPIAANVPRPPTPSTRPIPFAKTLAPQQVGPPRSRRLRWIGGALLVAAAAAALALWLGRRSPSGPTAAEPPLAPAPLRAPALPEPPAPVAVPARPAPPPPSKPAQRERPRAVARPPASAPRPPPAGVRGETTPVAPKADVDPYEKVDDLKRPY